jgi:Uma2 family endonuclease
MPRAQEKTDQRSRHAERYWTVARSGKYDDVACKIETGPRGNVVKEPPPTFQHKWFQNRILELLNHALTGGEAATEFPVATLGGMKLPDVVWVSYEAWREAVADDLALPVPRVCAEVLSPSNTTMEMQEKRRLYFEIGVEEVWICEMDGALRFYDADGAIETSRVVEAAPDRISTDIGP